MDKIPNDVWRLIFGYLIPPRNTYNLYMYFISYILDLPLTNKFFNRLFGIKGIIWPYLVKRDLTLLERDHRNEYGLFFRCLNQQPKCDLNANIFGCREFNILVCACMLGYEVLLEYYLSNIILVRNRSGPLSHIITRETSKEKSTQELEICLRLAIHNNHINILRTINKLGITLDVSGIYICKGKTYNFSRHSPFFQSLCRGKIDCAREMYHKDIDKLMMEKDGYNVLEVSIYNFSKKMH